MSSRVCAVVVTSNCRERLRTCLSSVLAQTRPADRILVVDNASTDGTRDMLDAEFAGVSRLDLKENAGGAGGINAGMRWAHCNKFDWIWVMDDSIEVLPDCLEKMLAFEGEADLIQVRESGATASPTGAGAWTRVQYCKFHAALISGKIVESAGMPDHRYYRSSDDTAYGYIASLRGTSICLDYAGIIRHAPETSADRASFYLGIRNRFLTREYLTKNGAPPAFGTFLAETTLALLGALSAAVESTDRLRNARAAIDGLRDGLHGRFDRLPAY